MNDGPELDLVELKRQLTDLADSAGPWDDPLPHIRERAVMTPPATRLPRRRWPAALDPVKLATVAAVAAVVVGAGWLIHDGSGRSGGASSEKAAAAAGSAGSQSSAAAAAGGGRAPSATSTQANSGSAGSCAVPTTTSKQLTLTAPARTTRGSVISVRVQLSAGASLRHTGILVFSHGLVVGRLVPISTVALPGARASLAGGAPATVAQVVGRLVYAPVPECDPPGSPRAPHPTARRDGPLPAGSYQLAATAQGHGSVQRSTPSLSSSTTETRLVMYSRRIAAGVAVIGLALTAGCSGAKGSKSSAVGPESSAAASARDVAGENSAAGGVGTSAVLKLPRSVVVTAAMSVVTKHVDTVADQVAALATANGGRTDGDDRSSGDGPRTAVVTVRIPPSRLDAVIAAIDRLATETSRTLKRADVTTAKADTDARVAALATSVSRLRNLLRSASGVGPLLQVEKVLTARQADLDSLRAQQRALGDQITLATLTVQVTTKSTVPVRTKHHFHATGFVTAMGSSIHGLGVAGTVVVAAVGYLLPVVVPVGLLVALAWFLRRRRPAAPPSVEEPTAG